MEDKIIKALTALVVLLVVVIPAGYFLKIVSMPILAGMMAVLAVLGFALFRLIAKFGKSVLDMKCGVTDPPEKFNAGDTVRYFADLSCVAPCEMTRFSVKIFASYLTESGVTMKSHTETAVHIENKRYVPGAAEKIQGSFKLPDDKRMFTPRHSWFLEFRCEIKSGMDKVETLEFIKNDKSLPFWDSI